MTRKYTLKRRAERQAETRRRIVEAAVDLHSTFGPALTTFTMLAERAGVQRHTMRIFPTSSVSTLRVRHSPWRSAIGCRMPNRGE